MLEGVVAEVAHGVLHTRGDDEVFGLLVLQHQPHALYIVLGIAPVAQRGEVAEVELILLALGDTCSGQCNLAGHEGLATALALVIEEDTRAAEHAICLAVLLHYPVTVKLGYGIGAIGVERGILILGYLLDLTIKFRSGGLVDVAGVGQAAEAYGLEDAEHTGGIYIGGELGGVEADLHVALGSEVIDLVGTHLAHHLDKAHRVAQVGIVKVEIRVALQMGDTFAVVD